MAAALYRSVTCNVLHTNSAGKRASTIGKAWGKADVLKLNEADGSAGIIRALKGVKIYMPGGSVGLNNPIMWRDSVFILRDSGMKVCYNGGTGDGPSRGVTWVLLEHRASHKRVLEFNLHEIHQAWTSHPERQDIWNTILSKTADEVNRVMAYYPGVPAVISGDMNRDNGVNFPGLAEAQIPTPVTYGGNKNYDQFFRVGGVVARGSAVAFDTESDHHGVFVNMEITAASAVAAPAAPPAPTVTAVATPAPATVQPSQSKGEDLRRREAFRTKPRWRFFAQRVDGTGTAGAILHPELPVQEPEIDDVLTGHNGFTATISPKVAALVAADGRPLLEEWGTAIWAEENGNIHGGGILTHSGFNGPEWQIECTGLTGYLTDLPYASSVFFVETDPTDIFRHIWAHVQSQPGGNLGLEVESTKSGILIGDALTQGEFDTQNGPLTFESGPYKLAWYQDHDLDDNASTLAADTPFDWHEEHYWVGDVLHHRLRIGYPVLGRRRNDLRFTIGENVLVTPDIERDGTNYADEAWALGAGEGSAMLRGVARRKLGRLRRVTVVADPALKSQISVNAAADREVAWRNNLDDLSSITVIDHPHADIASLQVGDEIRLQGETDWLDVDSWYRVTSRKIRPYSPDVMALSVMRTDRIAA